MRHWGGRHEQGCTARRVRRAHFGPRLRSRTGLGGGQASGSGGRSVRRRQARLFLRRRQICRRARQGDHAGPDLRRGAGAEEAASPLSAGADPRRGADRNQLDGHAGRPQGLGRVFRRTGLCRLHDRPADARTLGVASGRRRDADVHGEERAVPVHRGGKRRQLGGPRETHPMAGRRTQQGQEGRSDLRRVLRHAGRDRDLRRGDAEGATRMRARRCSTRSGPRSC